MKFKIFTIFSFMCFGTGIWAQNVGIGIAVPDASAKLDISSNNTGLLIPRVSLTATNAAAPVAAPTTSLLVYNTATAGLAPNNVTPGFYYWGGASWVRLLNGESNDWRLLGNAGTVSGTNFVGTTDAQALDFRTNNTMRFRIANGFQVFAMANGTAAAPFYSWNTDPNTGIYAAGADIVGVATNGIERARVGNTETVINEQSNIYNFRVESDANANMLFVDGTNNRVGIGTNVPTEALEVAGNLEFSGSLEPNALPGAVGQALVSQGVGVAPVWGVNVTGLAEISRWIYPPTNINANTTYTITATIPGVTSSSSAMVNLYGDWANFSRCEYYHSSCGSKNRPGPIYCQKTALWLPITPEWILSSL
jgi:hypothetical protein